MFDTLHNNTAVAQLLRELVDDLPLELLRAVLLLLLPLRLPRLRRGPGVLLTVLCLAAVVLTAVLGAGVAAVVSAAAVPAARVVGRRRGHVRDLVALEVDVYPALVLLGAVLQAELLAQVLDARLQLLNVADRVVALADDDVQVRLVARLRVADTRLQHVLGLLHELPVQIDRVVGHLVRRVVGAEDVLGRLLVVLVHLGRVRLALVAQLLGSGAVALLVGLMGLRVGQSRFSKGDDGRSRAAQGTAHPVEARVALRGLGAGQVSQAVIFRLRVIVVTVMGVGCCAARPSSQQD